MTQKRDKPLAFIKETGRKGLPAVVPVTSPKWEPPLWLQGRRCWHAHLTAVLKSDPFPLPPSAPGSHSAPSQQPIPFGLWLSCGYFCKFIVLPKFPGRYPCSFARKGRRWMSFLPSVYVYRIRLALSCVLQRSITKNKRKGLCGRLATGTLQTKSVLNCMIKANSSFQAWWPHLWLPSYIRKHKGIVLMWKFENYFMY